MAKARALCHRPGRGDDLFPIPTHASDPFHIVAGPDGYMWFTETSGNKFGRIVP